MARFLFHIAPEDESYLPRLKPLLQGKASVRFSNVWPSTAMSVVMHARKYETTQIVSSSEQLLKALLGKKAQLADYAGSIVKKFDCEFLFVPPVAHLVTTNTGKPLYERLLKKFLSPDTFITLPDFESQWMIFAPGKQQEILDFFEGSFLIATDIETRKENLAITCQGFTALRKVGKNGVEALTVVVPFTELYNIIFARQLSAMAQPKALQNGKYDIAYLMRYGVPLANYSFDTINLFHCWFTEFPKSLDFIAAYMLRDWVFWKDENTHEDLYEHYRYNAKDCFATAFIVLAILREMPQYAITNYLQEFPVVFPCILAEMTGVRVDKVRMSHMKAKAEKLFTSAQNSLATLTNAPGFNPGSPKQVKELLNILGCGDLKGTGKIDMDKAASRHPLNKRIIKSIGKYREDRKLFGTYLDDSKCFDDRAMYTLNPHGTDTFRLASKESAYWCGWQIQNIPARNKDIQVKECFVADDGFYLGEADGEQAEARYTAYLSGDMHLIAAVDDVTKDYHGTNASAFFGIPYDQIVHSYQVIDEAGNFIKWVHETVDKVIRDLAKRTNHGANYNMGPHVMLDTMGIENVMKAKKLLGLPASWKLLKVCEYLLACFASTYPVVKKDWYRKCVTDVTGTGMLVGPTGLTRRCFGKPADNKLDLNSYVAHPPQSSSAANLNKGFIKVFQEIWLQNPSDFKLLAQIHDSIFFQYRIGRKDLAWKVKECMEIPMQIKDTFGIERTLLVPCAVKGEATRWSELKSLGD